MIAAIERVLVLHRARLASLLAVWLGAGAASYLVLRHEPPAWSGAALLAAGTALVLLSRRRGLVLGFAAAWSLLAFGAGFTAGQAASWRARPVTQLPARAVLVTGQLRSVDLLPDGTRRVWVAAPELRLAPSRQDDAASQTAGGRMQRDLRIRLRAGDGAALVAGDTITVRALLRDPPYPDTPGGRDPQRDAFFGRLGGQGYALGDAARLTRAPSGGIAARWRRLREAVSARLIAALPGERGDVASVMLTGLGTGLPQADRDAFAAAGLAHLLAVAGLHIGIVIGVVMVLVRTLLAASEYAALRWPCRQIAAVAALLAGSAYLALTGAHIPIVRSFSMACLVTLALLAGRRALSMRGLAIVAALILLAAPDDVLDVGFQMSFAAVAALIAGYEALRRPMLWLHGAGGLAGRTRHHLAALVLTSLLAGLASAPFALAHFGRVQPWFVLANLVAVPMTAAVVLPFGLLAVLLMPVGGEGPPLWVMGHGIGFLIACARGVAALPAASLAVPSMPGWGLACVAIGLAVLCVWPTRARWLALLPLATGLGAPLVADRPTLLVSADAGLIGIAPGADGTMLVERGRGDSTALADWQQAWAARRVAPLPQSGEIEGGDVACTPAACTMTRRATSVLLIRAGGERATGTAIDAQACTSIALLVSPTPAEGACPGVPRIDRYSVWRDGPYAVWIDETGVRIASDRQLRGDRPWVPPPPFARHLQLTLPLAAAE